MKPVFKRSFLKGFLTLFSLSATAFIFQACYGSPADFTMDTQLEGLVVSAESNSPVEGIQVEVKGLNRLTYTDKDGRYSLFTSRDTTYTLVFTDIDSSLKGSFLQKEIILSGKNDESYFSSEISLEESI